MENELQVFQSNLEVVNNTLAEITNRVSKLENAATNGDDSIIQEINDRNRRANNLILFNMEEADFSSDSKAVGNILRKVLTDEASDNEVHYTLKRLGNRNPNKPRPLCVTLNSPNISRKILMNKNKYNVPSQDLSGLYR